MEINWNEVPGKTDEELRLLVGRALLRKATGTKDEYLAAFSDLVEAALTSPQRTADLLNALASAAATIAIATGKPEDAIRATADQLGMPGRPTLSLVPPLAEDDTPPAPSVDADA